MALPQQVTERLMQETPKTPGWSAELLSFAVAVFVISVVVYIGIVLGYQPYTNAQVKKLDDQIALFEKQVPASEQEQIAAFYSQLINVNMILGSRGSAQSVFGWLEGRTETNVSFGAVALNLDEGKISLSGTAKSADDVGYEARIFEQDPNVASVLLGSIAPGSSGEWQFSITITLVPGFFKVVSTSLSTP